MRTPGVTIPLLSLCISSATAQDRPPADSLSSARPLLFSISEATALNVFVDTFNRYVADSRFARISFRTMENNLTNGFDYDADHFMTNQFAHPYHGALFFNFARSTGHNYWASLTTAMIGSMEWEYFAENEPPAVNDWIQTSLSGAFLGEVTYRLTSFILDERTTGAARAWREIVALLIAPTRGFNRLIHGEMFRTTSEQLLQREPVAVNLQIGLHNIDRGIDLKHGTKNLTIGFECTYGLSFTRETFDAFDFFRFNMDLNFGFDTPSGSFFGYGILTGTRVAEGTIVGLFQHFDYLSNPVYRIGATALGGGILYYSPKQTFMGTFQFAGILMGAANSPYAEEFRVASLDSSRDYNFGPGLEGRIELNYTVGILRLYVGYYAYWIHTVQGAPGDELVWILRPKVRVDLGPHWQLGVEYTNYRRNGFYHGLYPDIVLQNNEQKVYFAYRIH